mmetsp:Transcript_21314/g.47081  ORF Transcript_21314/g.47081 Transcript_21314/m.47081 type:complete len:669 (+) Transcript_21314:39-2045(+)|eukprot:CAMPEP_0170595764 /NCGR_PEP_ID=MMETSP0224-20130122/14739_1 /TAXON_ID=285029 /ORGANISM="Togula jolla, Strain CCCM 725" /LENGTH=668 /DNA_ID=CAMNT_0010919973 /DNA_START=39 /DNA_END=2045 /DNA_ORIENTATION=+
MHGGGGGGGGMDPFDGQSVQRKGTEEKLPPLLADLESLPLLTDPEAVASRVKEANQKVGRFLDDLEAAALLSDVLCYDSPVVGMSRGFSEMTGFTYDDMLGNNCRHLLNGVPEAVISKSMRKNMRDFVRMCRVKEVDNMSEVTALQPNRRRDGTKFMNHFIIGRVMVFQHPYLLGVQAMVGEGIITKVTSSHLQEVAEANRKSYKWIRAQLLRLEHASGSIPRSPTGGAPEPEFRFFGERLQDHSVLLNRGFSVMRREPQELATNCLVFGETPVRHTEEGLFFSLLVDAVISTFEGFPLLGFTRRKPVDAPDLFPSVARCLGSSIFIGACGEAFVRDKLEHFSIGFKPPPKEEIESWTNQGDLPQHKRRQPVNLEKGDILGCQYTRNGHIKLWRNGAVLLDFDTNRPLDEAADYYAAVDVSFSVYGITLLPSPHSAHTSLEPTKPQLSMTDREDAGNRAAPGSAGPSHGEVHGKEPSTDTDHRGLGSCCWPEVGCVGHQIQHLKAQPLEAPEGPAPCSAESSLDLNQFSATEEPQVQADGSEELRRRLAEAMTGSSPASTWSERKETQTRHRCDSAPEPEVPGLCSWRLGSLSGYRDSKSGDGNRYSKWAETVSEDLWDILGIPVLGRKAMATDRPSGLRAGVVATSLLVVCVGVSRYSRHLSKVSGG